MVRPYIGDALRYLQITQEGKQWASNLYANVFSMEHRGQNLGRKPCLVRLLASLGPSGAEIREAIAHRQPEDSPRNFLLGVIDRWHGQPIREIQTSCSFTFLSGRMTAK